MLKETKFIKSLLKETYPNCKIHIEVVEVYNGLFSSDKIRVKTNIPYDDVKNTLSSVTENISIFPKGEFRTLIKSYKKTGMPKLNNKVSSFELIEVDSYK